MDEPIEYLYVDERRLSSYVEQIAGPVVNDRHRETTFALGFTGPQVQSSGRAIIRPRTTHEKLRTLTERLVDANRLGFGRAGGELFELRRSAIVDFKVERCMARRAVLPGHNDLLPAILWFSMVPESHPDARILGLVASDDAYTESEAHFAEGPLFLIEDFPLTDEPRPRLYSAYSALEALLEDYRNERRDTLLSHLHATERRMHQSGNAAWFGNDATTALREIGARVSDPRMIDTLYRIRVKSVEGVYGEGTYTTFAYPICIAEPSN